MLAKYKKQSNIAAGVWLCSLVALVALMPSAQGNIWDNGDILRVTIMAISAISFWYAFWAYAKAKGHSAILGLVLPLLSVIGLLILAGLKDRHPEVKSSREVK